MAVDYVEGSKRKEVLVQEAFEKFGGDQSKINDFLATRHVNAGGKTVLEMAAHSKPGLETARCLLKPRSGC